MNRKHNHFWVQVGVSKYYYICLECGELRYLNNTTGREEDIEVLVYDRKEECFDELKSKSKQKH